MYRRAVGGPEVFLVHPGGPFIRNRDEGAWSIPKGELEEGEEPLEVARREFREETGREVDECAAEVVFRELGSVVQRGGKTVYAWAFEGAWPEGLAIRSNTFRLEWPPGSSRECEFPEVDQGRFFPLSAARKKINPAQEAFLDRLLDWGQTSSTGVRRERRE
jgi:predicted NUDIX family NTP pyrophosphohydrolase